MAESAPSPSPPPSSDEIRLRLATGDAEAVDVAIDLTIEAGPDARVGDLLVAAADLCPAIGAALDADAGVVLADGSWIAADDPLDGLDLLHGDRLVVGPRPRPAPSDRLRTVRSPDGRFPRTRLPDGGRVEIGRRPAGRVAIVLDDPSVSRRHAAFVVDDEVTVVDLGSTNGTTADGVPITPSDPGHEIEAGAVVRVGDVELVVEEARRAGAGCATTVRSKAGDERIGAAIRVHVPPRLVPAWQAVDFAAPPAPRLVDLPRLSWAAVMVPVVVAGAIVGATGALAGGVLGVGYLALSAGFLLLGPVMAVATHWESRRRARSARSTVVSAFEAAVKDLAAAVDAAVAGERAALAEQEPCVATMRARAGRTAEGLWSRSDAMTVRIGVCALPSAVTVAAATIDDVDIDRALAPGRRALDGLRARLDAVPGLPLVVDTVGCLAIVGDPERTASVAAAIVLRLATDFPPDRLVIDASQVASDERWAWVRWLPHAGDTSRVCGANCSHDLHVVLDTGRAEAVAGAMRLWLGSRRDLAPSDADVVVEVDDNGVALVSTTRSGRSLDDVLLDTVRHDHAHEWARALAPFLGRGDVAPTPPATVGLGDVLGVGTLDDPAVLAERWARPPAGLVATLGHDGRGPGAVDLRRDGPHTIVAGTTGAGKSELLQTMVASLAAMYGPERVTFLLVDYKGGAAFGDCATLPHTVGIVTDLDGALVDRVLVSLRAEVRRREELLASAGHPDLARFELVEPADAPPNLVVVVDEFASLVAEVPGFVEGMVDLARRGRSLGIHLVLATQRPAGVVSEHLRANASLRIALRVADSGDSVDVVGDPAAAHIGRDQAGRAVVRTGHGELVEWQIAHAGRRSGVGTGAPVGDEVRVRPLGRRPDEAPIDADAPTDLQRLVRTARRTARATARSRPRRPWLDPLPNVIGLRELWAPPDHEPPTTGPIEVVLGVADQPGRQAQFVLRHDLTDGHVLFAGEPAVVVDAVRSSVVSAVVGWSPTEVVVDVVDGAGRSARDLACLPQVGTVIDEDDTERIGRLLSELRAGVDGVGARRLLVIHDLAAFVRTHDGTPIAESFARVVADAGRSGVHVIAATDRRIGLSSALIGGFARRLVMAMGSLEEQVAMSGAVTPVGDSVLAATRSRGRGIVDGLVVQTTVVDDAELRALGRRERARLGPGVVASAIGALPSIVGAHDVAGPVGLVAVGTGTTPTVLVGVGDRRLEAVHLALDGDVLVAGPPRSGRTSAIGSMAASLDPWAADAGLRRVLVSPRSGPWTASDRWDAVAAGPDAVEVVDAVAAAVVGNDGARQPSPMTVVFVDDADDLDSGVDEALARLAALRSPAVRLVVAAESSRARSAYSGVIAHLRRQRRALLLQPDVDLDGDLAGTRLPRRSPRPSPPGRGELVDRGEIELVQVALADP